MTHVLVRFDLEDYESWKDAFEDRTAVREENGCRDETLFARSGNHRKVVLLAEWDSPENAEAYFDGADFRQVMRNAGVVRKPDVTVLDRIEDIDAVTPEQEPTEEESADEESSGESTEEETSEAESSDEESSEDGSTEQESSEQESSSDE
jgi:quinol monooxygenase YgiN